MHGEYTHLVAHAALARGWGMGDDRVLLCEDGDQVVLSDDGLVRGEPVARGDRLYVDGMVGDLGHRVLGERRVLGDDGFVAIVLHVDLDRREILAGPDVVTRGWVEQPALRAQEAAVADVVEAEVGSALEEVDVTIDELARVARRAAGRTVNDRTRRRPMIVPVVREG